MPKQPYIEHFRSLRDMPTALDSYQLARLEPMLKAHAFFSAKVEDIALLRGLRQLCERGLQKGWNEATFRRYAREWMREATAPDGKAYNGEDERKGWTEDERRTYERDTRHIDSLARLKLIFRTQMSIASEYTAWQHGMSEQQRYDYPAWEFFRQPGAITKRRDHVEHEGEIVLKTDYDYWLERNDPSFGGFGVPWPPFGYNSWMHIAPVDRDTCESLGLIHRNDPVQPLPTAANGSPIWGLPEKDISEQLSVKSVKTLTDDERKSLAEWCRKHGVEVSLPNQAGEVKIAPKATHARRRLSGTEARILDAVKHKGPPFRVLSLPEETRKLYVLPSLPEKKSWSVMFGHDCSRHILKRHGMGTESYAGQIPVTESDWLRLVDMIAYPQTAHPVAPGKDGQPRFKISRKHDGVQLIAIVEVSFRKNGIKPVTFYKKK